MRLLLLLLAHSLLPPRAAARGPPPLVFDFLPSGAYKVVVDGDVWFASDDTFVHVGGKRYSLRAGTLTLQRTDTTTGHDTLGAFTQTNLALKARSTPPVSVMFAVKAWADGETLQFIQSFPDGLPASQSPELDAKNGVSTAFPSWRPATLVGKPRGWVAYDGWDCAKDGGAVGCMKQDVAPAGHVAYGRWSNDTTQLPGGLEGSGPMAIFTADLTRTVVVSAFTNTMASSQVFAHDPPPSHRVPGRPSRSISPRTQEHGASGTIHSGARTTLASPAAWLRRASCTPQALPTASTGRLYPARQQARAQPAGAKPTVRSAALAWQASHTQPPSTIPATRSPTETAGVGVG